MSERPENRPAHLHAVPGDTGTPQTEPYDPMAEFAKWRAENADHIDYFDDKLDQTEAHVAGLTGSDRRRALQRARVDDDGVVRGPRLIVARPDRQNDEQP